VTAPQRRAPRVDLPDPPLVDREAGIELRPWSTTATDAAALVRAWSDPAIAPSDRVPSDRSEAAAAAWLRDEPARRTSGRNLDLVIAPLNAGPEVLGEVGLRNIDHGRRRAEITWWVAAEHRGRGRASAAARLLADWALSDVGGMVQVWARVLPSNAASADVAATAGFVELGTAAGTTIWARHRRG
jgi:RimJ/RimL family protein N-acetyltransferase